MTFIWFIATVLYVIYYTDLSKPQPMPSPNLIHHWVVTLDNNHEDIMTWNTFNGPLTRYVKLRVVHAPGMPGTFSLPPTSMETASKRSRHASRHVRHAPVVMHVGIANPRRWGKRSRHTQRMRNPQFYVSGKRSMQSGFCMKNRNIKS